MLDLLFILVRFYQLFWQLYLLGYWNIIYFFVCCGFFLDICNGMKCFVNKVCEVVKGKVICQCLNVCDCGYFLILVCGLDGIDYFNECYF